MSETCADFSISPVRRELPQDKPGEITQFSPGGAEFQLVVTGRALNGIRRMAGASPREEIGGVLVGRHFRTGSQYLVNVEDHVAVPSQNRGAAHFDFDDSSVQAIFQRLESRPDQYVVGWYHSHIKGTPFMSFLDKELHESHFRLPWHVSCVVSAGAWGRPAGFWRMVSGELEEIADYAVSTSGQDELLDKHQQFLAACALTEAEPKFTLTSLLPTLGVATDGPIALIMASQAEASRTSPGLSDVLFLINTAKAAGSSPAAVAELESLRERLRHVRLFSDVCEPLLISGALDDKMSIKGNECYSYSDRSGQLIRLDIDQRVVIPVRIAGKPVSVAHAPDDHAWVLTASNRLIRMPILDTTRWLDGDHHFPAVAVSAPKLSARPRQLEITQSTFWLRSDTLWHRIQYTQDDDDVVLGALDAGPLPVADCIMVPGNGLSAEDTEPMLIASADGMLRIWVPGGEDGWRLTREAPLPAAWHDLTLTHGCQHGLGWFLLFAGDTGGRLGLFDRESLELTCQLVRPADENLLLPLKTIGGDGQGHLYALAGGLLHRA